MEDMLGRKIDPRSLEYVQVMKTIRAQKNKEKKEERLRKSKYVAAKENTN